jgi:hypothetical protein
LEISNRFIKKLEIEKREIIKFGDLVSLSWVSGVFR